jgi:predicted RNA-binding Zn ribbon-like protein
LANTRRNGRSGPIDEIATGTDLRRWLSDRGLATDADVGERDLEAMRELRDAVRELLLARVEGRGPEPKALEVVNAASAAAPTARLLVWEGADAPIAERDGLGADGVALARSLLAADAIDLIAGPSHADLLACQAPGCMRFLLRDHPRRHWCSTRCGDRVRASRYYRRHRDARPRA